jgi:hypothetical protein
VPRVRRDLAAQAVLSPLAISAGGQADIVAKREGTDKAAVEAARKGCDEALKLHEQGNHKESMVKVGEAIAGVSRAPK